MAKRKGRIKGEVIQYDNVTLYRAPATKMFSSFDYEVTASADGRDQRGKLVFRSSPPPAECFNQSLNEMTKAAEELLLNRLGETWRVKQGQLEIAYLRTGVRDPQRAKWCDLPQWQVEIGLLRAEEIEQILDASHLLSFADYLRLRVEKLSEFNIATVVDAIYVTKLFYRMLMRPVERFADHAAVSAASGAKGAQKRKASAAVEAKKAVSFYWQERKGRVSHTLAMDRAAEAMGVGITTFKAYMRSEGITAKANK